MKYSTTAVGIKAVLWLLTIGRSLAQEWVVRTNITLVPSDPNNEATLQISSLSNVTCADMDGFYAYAMQSIFPECLNATSTATVLDPTPLSIHRFESTSCHSSFAMAEVFGSISDMTPEATLASDCLIAAFQDAIKPCNASCPSPSVSTTASLSASVSASMSTSATRSITASVSSSPSFGASLSPSSSATPSPSFFPSASASFPSLSAKMPAVEVALITLTCIAVVAAVGYWALKRRDRAELLAEDWELFSTDTSDRSSTCCERTWHRKIFVKTENQKVLARAFFGCVYMKTAVPSATAEMEAKESTPLIPQSESEVRSCCGFPYHTTTRTGGMVR